MIYLKFSCLITTGELSKDKSKNYLTFRQIQVMLVEYRDIYSGVVLMAIAAGGMFAQVATLYISIDLVRQGEVTGQLGMMLACTWVTCGMALIFIFIYGTLADVYKVSLDQHLKIRSSKELMTDKLFRRFFRSCPILRIYLSGSNYLEPETPLNIEDRVVEQTIDFLLL